MIEAVGTSANSRCIWIATIGVVAGATTWASTTKETSWVIKYRDLDECNGSMNEKVDEYYT